jgi:ferredoxin
VTAPVGRTPATARRVRVDRDVCVGAGQCVLAAPGVFDQGDQDGLSYVLVDPVPPALAPAVQDAAARCPARAVLLDAEPADAAEPAAEAAAPPEGARPPAAGPA